MPKKRKDTTPTIQMEDAKLSRGGPQGGGEITAAADQLAAVTLADDDEAGSGTSESQQDSVDQLHDPLSDPELWKTHPKTEDCPVCLVPLPLEVRKTAYASCCGKTICVACNSEHLRALKISKRSKKEEMSPVDIFCPFCREPATKDDLEWAKQLEKLADKGDTEAMVEMAFCCREGRRGFTKDGSKCLALLKKAADVGSASAMHHLGYVYIEGDLDVPKDKKKGIGYLKEAVKVGGVASRRMVALLGVDEGNFHLATLLANKHLRLAAEAGDKHAVKDIWKRFYEKKVDKAELEEILKAHQAACDEMDSEDRRRYDAFQEASAGTDVNLKDLYGTYYNGFINAKQLKEALEMHRNGSGFEEVCEFLIKCSPGITQYI